MCGECAPNTAVSHKIAAAKNWKKHIPLRQGQVTLSSVIQRAEQKKWYTLGNWLQVFHEIRAAKTCKQCWLNKADGGMLMERIALDTAACQRIVKCASSFWSMAKCFSKFAYSTANFAVANADKQNAFSGNIKISTKHRHLLFFVIWGSFSEAAAPDRHGAPIHTNSRSTAPAAAY